MGGTQAPEAQAACRAAAYGVVRAAYRGVPAPLLKSRVMEAVGGNKVRSATRQLKKTISHCTPLGLQIRFGCHSRTTTSWRAGPSDAVCLSARACQSYVDSLRPAPSPCWPHKHTA